jgi:chromosome partitioning protein
MSDSPAQKFSFKDFLAQTAATRNGSFAHEPQNQYDKPKIVEAPVANESSLDAAARERMMYEGSDREEIPARPVAKAEAEQPPRAAQPKPQKAYPAKPLTEKTKKAVPSRPRLIGIANQKGGVGKTTTAINLATALCAVGKKVLLIDMDPQGNASTGLGVRRSLIRTSVYDVLFEGADVVEAAVTTRVPNLSVVPSSIHLSGAEIELVTADNREYRLKKALHRALPFDYVIVDCPPSLNLLTLNALVAVDSILVPLQCEFYALEGLSHLVKTIERVQKSFNPTLDIHGIILTMYDLRNKLSAQVEEDVRGHFGDKVYKTVIPRNVRLSEAPSYGLPAIVYDMKCTGAQAYIKLAKEVILRERSILASNAEETDDSAQVA